MIERFFEELAAPSLIARKFSSGHLHDRDEDDRNIAFLFFQPGLQLQADISGIRISELGTQARVCKFGFEEFFRDPNTVRLVQPLPLGRE